MGIDKKVKTLFDLPNRVNLSLTMRDAFLDLMPRSEYEGISSIFC